MSHLSTWFGLRKKKCQRLELENNYDFFMNCHNTKGMHEKFIEYNNQFTVEILFLIIQLCMFNEIEVIIGMDFDVFEVYYIYDMIKLIINVCNWISILHYLTFWNVYLILDFKYNT